MPARFQIHTAPPSAFAAIGKMMADVYAGLDGFPGPDEQPAYYNMLYNVGAFTENEGTEILVAEGPGGQLAGAVVYFNDMQHYGSGGTATREKNAAGFRLLAVAPAFQGQGVGKLLTQACIRKAKAAGHRQLIIHSTQAMLKAWSMYEKLGFKRSADLDFMQGSLPVFGFRYFLDGGSEME